MGIAVIIPVYNTEKYLVECLESVVHQTREFDQVIIIDDGSIDDSLKICQEYEKKYHYIKVVSKVNEGQGVARNLGLEMVTCEYVMFLDSDDYIQKDTVKIISNHLEKNSLDMLYFDSNIQNDLDDKIRKNSYDRTRKSPRETMSGCEYFEKCYPHAYTVSPCMVVFRSEFLNKRNLRFPKVRIYEDMVFSFIAVHEAKRVQYIPNKLYVRRYRENSTVTSELTYKKWKQLSVCYLECLDYIRQNIRSYSKTHIESILVYLLVFYSDLRAKKDGIEDSKLWDKSEWHNIQQEFIKNWNVIFREDVLDCFRLNKRLSYFLRSLKLENDAVLINFFNSTYPNLKSETWDKYISDLRNILEQLPLCKKQSNVGIYGIGYHTEQLLNWYQRVCGELSGNLYFIDTYIETGRKTYKDHPVINVNDIETYAIDKVIISSNDFESDMYDTLIKVAKENCEIYCFYKVEKEIIFLNYEKCFSKETER